MDQNGYRCEQGRGSHTADRRGFLKQAVGCVAGTLALFGLGPDLPVYFVAASAQGQERRYPIPLVDSVNVDHDAQVILVRNQGHVFAMSLACPHQNGAVRWLAEDHRFQCSRHDSKYQPDGTYTSGRATRNLDRFPIRRDADAVVVDVSRVFRSDQESAGWASATVAV